MKPLADVTPAGTQTYSKAPDRYPPGCPAFAERAAGPHVWGSDGRRYVDLVSALGAVILGHRDPDVEEAILAQLARGTSFSLPTRLEGEVAELIGATFPGVEMTRFLKNGADACAAAVRLARAATAREAILTIGYHGWLDWTVADTNPAGVPDFNRRLAERLPYGDLNALEYGLDDHAEGDVACLIIEPVVSANPVAPPPGYLKACAALCAKHGALLIFDEVVTGFRTDGFSAAAAHGVTPDLFAAGKAAANGLPLSFVAGRRELMELMAKRDGVFCSTTFGGETLALAAALATICKLRELDGPRRLGQLGRNLVQIIRNGISARGLEEEARVVGWDQRPVIQWRRPALKAAFGARLLASGVLTPGYLNLTLAHAGVEGQIGATLTLGLEAAVGRLHREPEAPISGWS